MSESSNAYRIEPLEGAQGYPTWATKIMDILTELDYDEYITGSHCEKPIVPNQTGTAAIAALTEWERKQCKSLTVIRLRVAQGPMAYIQRATTGVEAWNKLQSVYQPKGAINIIRLRRQIFCMACEGENIEEHIRKLTDVKGALEEYGTTISEVEFAITILTSLPDSWDTWVGGIDLASIQTSDDIIACILQQANRPGAKPDSDDTALPAHSGSSSSNHREGACFHCGRPGHRVADCCDKQNGKTYGEHQKQQNYDCYQRNKKSRGRGNRGGSSKAHVAEEKHEEDIIFVATERHGLTKDLWLLDSAEVPTSPMIRLFLSRTLR
ncbi:hypothetical protein MVEN_00030800 [Mycena venus]|uniref:CCHC-type domain-containing protein n=1 Tax=Mycena venus TaxID=2733690 RepID=A0A8H7DGV2_9AGAR|nr:hypothetical protein MVEN_00030800 [Mycena venus]